MKPLSGPGIVLRRGRRAEEDVQLTVFLRATGQLLVTSRGGQRVQSKMRSLQEPFTEADYQLFAPDDGVSARLAGGKLLDSHEGLRFRMEAFETASRACEAVDALLPFRAPSADVYDILRSALRSLSGGSSASVEWVLFAARLLRCLGHGDVTGRLIGLLDPAVRDAASRAFERRPDAWTKSVPPESLEKCHILVDAELEQILPWRLKSERASRAGDQSQEPPEGRST